MNDMLALDTVPRPVKLRVEDYILLDDSGAFSDYAKTELLNGEIVFLNAQHRPHARIKTVLAFRLQAALQQSESSVEAVVEGAVSLPPLSVVEPDIVLTSDARGDGFIPLASVKLVVEVSDTTLTNDLDRKALLYAAHGIPEYWVADVTGRVIHQLWSPAPEGYRDRRQVAFGAALAAATLTGLEIATGGL